jgi:hypothetical protein
LPCQILLSYRKAPRGCGLMVLNGNHQMIIGREHFLRSLSFMFSLTLSMPQLTECSLCKDFWHLGFLGYYTVKAFQGARLNGCLACGTVLDAVEAFSPGWTHKNYEERLIRVDKSTISISIAGDFRSVNTFEVFRSQGKSSAIQCMSPHYPYFVGTIIILAV